MNEAARRVYTVDTTKVAWLSELTFDSQGDCIYALMVTGKSTFHAGFARNAIISFLSQTYGNRSLVIVNDGDFELDVVGVPAERIIQIQLKEQLVLGALRNHALDQLPQDAVWVQWDDDDWHHPELMVQQYKRLTEMNVNTCLLKSQVKYAFLKDSGWVDSHSGGFAGTLMSRNRADLRYPEVVRSEDSAYCMAIKKSVPWFAWNNPPHYYLRFIHGHNTWHPSHFRLAHRRRAEWHMPTESANYLKSVLELYST